MRAFPCLLLLSCACQLGAGQYLMLSPLDADGNICTRVGEVVSLNCTMEGEGAEEHLDEVLEWRRNGLPIQLDPHNRFSPSRLCVQNVTIDDHQVIYSCHLKRNPIIAAATKIKVHFPPALSGTEHITVEETKDAVLHCSVWAYPQVTVVWLKDGKSLDLVTYGYTIYQDSREARLTILDIERERHQGSYTCKARSTEFGMWTKTFELLVEDKKMGFPLAPAIAACVIVALTVLLAMVSRWNKITKCCK